MNNKTAKKLRKQAGYDVNENKTRLEDYDFVDTSTQFAEIVGTLPNGKPNYKVVTTLKYTASLKKDHPRKVYQDLKKGV